MSFFSIQGPVSFNEDARRIGVTYIEQNFSKCLHCFIFWLETKETVFELASSGENLSSGLRPGKTQTCPLSYRDKLEAWNFAYRNNRYYTI